MFDAVLNFRTVCQASRFFVFGARIGLHVVQEDKEVYFACDSAKLYGVLLSRLRENGVFAE